MLNIVQFFKCIKKNENFIPIVLLFVFFIINCIIFWKSGIILMMDIGREYIIPQAILDGKVLYRDILNIYGPLAFIINAFAFKLFGVKFSTLNFMGAISGAVFVFSCYFLSKEFLSRKLSLVLSLLICTCIFNETIFNFLLPYSFNVIYALSAYALSGLFLIRYVKYGNLKDILITAVAAGFCISNKVEYYFLPIIIALSVLYFRPLKLKNLVKVFAAFMLFPVLCLIFLLLQGLSLADILNALVIIKTSALAPTMIWFHKFIGLYPDKLNFINGLKPSLFMLLFVFISFLCWKFTENKRYLRWFLIFLLFIFMVNFIYFLPKLFCYFPMLFVLLTLLYFKRLIKDKCIFVLCLLSIGASLKTFFSADVMVYGFYTLLLIFIGIAVLFNKIIILPKRLEINPFEKERFTTFLVLFFTIIFFVSHISIRMRVGDYKLIGVNDNLTSIKVLSIPLNDMVSYLKTNTNENDRVLVYPEGEIINFLSGRKPDYMYYSLHPIFMDTFGEENVIKRIKSEKIEYIIMVEGFSMPKFGRTEDYNMFNNFVKENYIMIHSSQSSRKKDGLYLYKLVK